MPTDDLKAKGRKIIKGTKGYQLREEAEDYQSLSEGENRWNGPAFCTMGGLTFDIQAGGSASKVILLIMTDGGVAAKTVGLSADILSFSRSQDLFGNVSVAGAVVAVRSALNRSYYGKPVMPADILIVKSASNPQAKGLREAIEKAAAGN